MKQIDKVKKKLKRWEWLNKHLGNTILAVYLPLITLYILFSPINFIVSFVCLCLSFLTLTIGGLFYFSYAEDTNFKILYEKQIAAMESVTEEKLNVLSKSIENFKENNIIVGDKQNTKRLIKELIVVYKSSEKAFKEKQNIENEEKEDTFKL